MSKHEKEEQKKHDLVNEMIEELDEETSELDEENTNIEDNLQDEELSEENDEQENNDLLKIKEAFARQQADYDNFKKRVERDREDMMFFLKSDILKKVLPRIDDMQRIITVTPELERAWAIYEWIVSIEKKLTSDLEKLGVKAFSSKWETVNPDKHEVMTQIPGEDWVIVEEFEKGYMIGDRVLRVAKVVVGQN